MKKFIEKYWIILVFLLFLTFPFLSGCENNPPKINTVKKTNSKYHSYYKVCLEDVYYWNSIHQMAPAYNSDGTLQTCEE